MGHSFDTLRIAAHQSVKEKNYWLKKMAGEPVKSVFPYDYREDYLAGSREDQVITFGFSKAVNEKLAALCKGSDDALHMVLLAGLVLLLAKYTGNEDILMGTPIYRNDNNDGDFINTVLPIRTQIEDNKTFKELLLNIRETVIEADEHLNYPMEILANQLNLSSSANDFPLFDVALLVRNIHEKRYLLHINLNMIFFFLKTGEFVEAGVEYNASRYKKTTVERIIKHFIQLLSQALFNLESTLSDISILCEDEKKQVLFEFNDTEVEYPRNKTVLESFARQVRQTPHHIALQASRRNAAVTYDELNLRSDGLACLISQKGLQPDTIAAIMVERSIEMIAGILGILKAGGAYLPIDPGCPKERIDFMLTDSGVRILLTSPGTQAKYKADVEGRFIEIIDIPGGLPSSTSTLSKIGPANLAYIIYTSGTTGKPKGVMVEHRNLLAYIHAFYREFELTTADTMLQQASFTFDAFVEEVYPILLKGGKLAIPAKEEIPDIDVLVEFIAARQVTIISCSPLLLNELNLRSGKINTIHTFISGGDVLKREHIDGLLKTANVYNTYGPTETTVCAAYFKCPPCTGETIPIGKPIANYKVYILDKNNKLMPIGVVGELCVAGAGVTRGYLNNPELTAERFLLTAKTREETRRKMGTGRRKMGTGEEKYRTGDLARWLPDGNIEFSGRIDHQVKIRGYRIELGEIESKLLKHKRIQKAVVLAKEDDDGDKYLCAYIVTDSSEPGNSPDSLQISQLRKHLTNRLPDYMIPSYFVQVEKIPVTPSGKLNIKALPKPEIVTGSAYAAPRDEMEKKLAEIWRQVLFNRIEVNESNTSPGLSMGIDDNFFELGGHSLKATILTAKIQKEMNVKVPLAEVFKYPTIRKMARYITGAGEARYEAVEVVEKKEYYMLSSAQKRLYIIYRMVSQSTAYNMPEIIHLQGETGIEKLNRTVMKLIAHHESLRTSFHMIGQQPVQRIHDRPEFEIEYISTAGDNEESTVHNLLSGFIRPFDLSQAPLLRVGLVKIAENRHILIIDMHHIICDGISRGILERNFTAYNRGRQLPPLKLQYKDYAHWQMKEKTRETLKGQERYWLEEFAGEIPVLDIPNDYPRPTVQQFEGETLHMSMGKEKTRELNRLARSRGVTMYMLLLALTTVLLSKLGNQEDIIVGTPIAGRPHADLEEIIGMFVNTLAMRNYPASGKTFTGFLQEVKTRTLQAFENQDYQFEELVDRLTVNRDIRRNPLFDVVLAFQDIENDPSQPAAGGGVMPESPVIDRFEGGISKFDLTLGAAEKGGNLSISINYSTSLFKRETPQRFLFYLRELVTAVIAEPNRKLSELEIITGEEKKRLLYDFSRTGILYSSEKNLAQLFETQAEKTPEQIALCQSRSSDTGANSLCRQLTYRQVREKTNGLVRALKKEGLTPGRITGLILDRSIEMILGILSILKAGAAYLPLNPQNPMKRNEYMLEDSGVEFILANKTYGEMFNEKKKYHIIDPEDETLYIHRDGEENIPGNKDAFNNLAYVIYTSGSTGNPKGVPVTHANLSPLLHWGYSHLDIGFGDRVLQNLSYFFDWSVWEIFIALTTGARLYMVPDSVLFNPGAQVDFIDKNGITILHITPTQFRYTANLQPAPSLETLRYLFLGAEKLNRDLVWQCINMLSEDCRVYNMYGPTEAAIISAVLDIDKSENSKNNRLDGVPIGRPVGNTHLLVLDKNMKLCPIQVAGELFIGGTGLAAGYLNDPEKSVKSFINNRLAGLAIKRWYRTGDLVRWLPDANMEFLNRIDYQVKIRGFRIELAEIENRMAGHPNIAGVVVIDRKRPSNEKYLCAYIIPGGSVSSQSENLETPALKKYLSAILPDYMIPSYFVIVDKFPLTANGKIDRKALPQPEIKTGGDYIAPGNETEETLVKIWRELLDELTGTLKIGINDGFFDLGGHSLKAAQLAAQIQKYFGLVVPLVELFRRTTIKEQAEYIMYLENTGEKRAGIHDENVVLLREVGSAAGHLFFVHDGSGEVEGYIEFCRQLKAEFNCWGIRTDRSENAVHEICTIEELAGNYIENIKKIQARGPYYICGWSLGGTIAFEMVKQLEQVKQEVAFLALIDSVPPGKHVSKRRKGGQSFPDRDSGPGEPVDPESLKKLIPPDMAQIIPNYEQLGTQQLLYYLKRIRALNNAQDNYSPGRKIKIKTRAHYFKAGESKKIKEKRWSGYFKEPVKVYRISGDHFSIFREPQVGALAGMFDGVLVDRVGVGE